MKVNEYNGSGESRDFAPDIYEKISSMQPAAYITIGCRQLPRLNPDRYIDRIIMLFHLILAREREAARQSERMDNSRHVYR
jgi:hypothetical protein